MSGVIEVVNGMRQVRFEDGSIAVSNGEPDIVIDLKDGIEVRWGKWIDDETTHQPITKQ